MGECVGCEKLNAEVAKLVADAEKLQGKLTGAESNLEKALDDLAAATAARDEAIKKANKIAKEAEAPPAVTPEKEDDDDGLDVNERTILERIMDWPF